MENFMELKVKVNLEDSSLLKELVEAIDEFNKAINQLEKITTKLGEIQVGLVVEYEKQVQKQLTSKKFIPESSNGICKDTKCTTPY